MTITTLAPEASEADIVKRELLDELQVAWKTFGRLDLAIESRAERKTIERLRDRLSDLMNELEGIR